MSDILAILAPWMATTIAIFFLITIDERRLTDDRRLRMWPSATKLSAVIVFGPISVPIHFARTRGALRGIPLGIAWMIAAGLVNGTVGFALDLALGIS
jgi:hypothetical protein